MSCNVGGGGHHCLASMDSDLEAFNRNPTDGSFAVLAFQLAAFTKYLNEVPYWRVNTLTLWDFCVSMIGRADIEGSKSNVAVNAWLPQDSFPCERNLGWVMVGF